jgi:hypothetical protein
MKLSGVKIRTERYVGFADEVLQRADGPNLSSRKVVSLERFKFWLGMPNNYYNSES